MADHTVLENLLNQLMTPNNEVIQKATEDLKQIVNEPSFVPALCVVLTSSESPQVRQYAAVLLRRKIMRNRQWLALSDEIKSGLKVSMFDILKREPETAVRNSLAQLIGTVAHHCDDLTEWPQLLAFLEQYVKSENSIERQVSMMILRTVSSEAIDLLSPHIPTILSLCGHALYDEDLKVSHHAIQVMNNVVDFVSTDEMKQFSNMIPRILEVIQLLAVHDEDEACTAMEIFDQLVECEVAILHPHVRTIVDFCLRLAENEDIANSVRIKALEAISWLVSMKKKAIQKMNLIQPILDVVFSLMCRCGEDEDDLEDSEESEKAASYAARIMDSLALHLPPEKIVTHVIKNSTQALSSPNPSERKAGYIALGIIAEGCSDHISNNYLEQFLSEVVKGFEDEHAGVRNGAMFALGQFSEFLQPGITKYANEIIPLLVNYAVKVRSSPNPSIATLTRTYYALEIYVENLEKDVFPYLPDLMTHMLQILEQDGSDEMVIKLKEFSFSCIGSLACAAKTNLNQYFAQIMEHFKKYLSGFESDNMKEIQLQALETLSTMAREMDEATFTPDIANMCLGLGLSLIGQFNDPDVRRCVYNLFSAMATLTSTDMIPHLATIVQYMLQSMKSSEGIKVHYTAEDSAAGVLGSIDLEDTNNEIEVDEDDYAGITIENAYLEEKEDACTSLSDLALQYYEHFMPYIEECYQETLKLLDYGSVEVTKSAIKALANFTIAVFDYNKKAKDEASATALKAMMEELIPKYLDIVCSDKDRGLAMNALHCIQEMLDSIGEPVLQASSDTFTDIVTVVKEVLLGRIACQDVEEDGGDAEEDEEQAELDSLLLEYAAGILPLLAKLTNAQTFSPYLKEFMPLLLRKCKGHCTSTEKSYAIGTIAECLDMMSADSGAPYTNQLYPLLIKGCKDSDDELRNNSVFALGVLITTSNNALAPKYGEILQMFHDMVKREKGPRVRDNICASTARILSAGHSALPVSEVYTLLIELMPLNEDVGEYETVCQCIVNVIYPQYKQVALQTLPQLLLTINEALKTDKLSSGTSEKLALMVKDLQATEPERIQTAITAVPSDSALWNLFPNGV